MAQEIDGKAVVYPHRRTAEIRAVKSWSAQDEAEYLRAVTSDEQKSEAVTSREVRSQGVGVEVDERKTEEGRSSKRIQKCTRSLRSQPELRPLCD